MNRNPGSSSCPSRGKRPAKPEASSNPLFNIKVSYTGFDPQYPPDYVVQVSSKGFSLKISHPGSPSQAPHPRSSSQAPYQPFPHPGDSSQFSSPNWGFQTSPFPQPVVDDNPSDEEEIDPPQPADEGPQPSTELERDLRFYTAPHGHHQERAMEGIQEMMERLRSIVGPESWDYCVLWKPSKDQRWIEWVDCCCSGSYGGGGGGGEDNDGGGEMVFECKDVLFHHPTTHVCHLLSLLPSSMPFDSIGIYGQTIISNQPRWLNLSNSDFSDDQENLGTKALIPVPIGLVELFVSKQISEDESIINFVTAMFNMPPIDHHPMLNSNNNNNNNVESSFSVNMDGLDDGESKDYLLLDDHQKDPHFQPPISPATMLENLNLTTPNNNSNISSDLHPMNFLQHFNYSTDHNRNANNIMFINHDDPFDPQDNVGFDHEIDMALQGQLMNQKQQSHLMDPPLENNNNNNNIGTKKQGIINNNNDINRSDSVSDCSDQNDEEDDPKCRRRNGKPQSKNLVAERKRRKKLNDRLYTLRSLVPKITKLDRASILKDAIEYVMELKRQVEELQNELEENSDDEDTTNNQSTIVEQEVMHANGSNRKRRYSNGHGMLVNGGPQLEAYSGIGTIEVSKHNQDIEDANEKGQQMEPQVEVVSLDGNEFFVKVFCEHKMGGFVRLMEAFNSLGLELTNVNVTSFRCLVLNVFKVERKDSEMVQADHRANVPKFRPPSLWRKSNRVSLSDNGVQFDWRWRRRPKEGRESEEIDVVRELCETCNLGEGEEKWTWALEGNGAFTISSLRIAIDDTGLRRAGPSTGPMAPWPTFVDPTSRPLSLANLVKLGMNLECILCPLCKEKRETLNHLLVECEKSKEVRVVVNSWWNSMSVNVTRMEELIASTADHGSHNRKMESVKEVVKQGYVWVIWKYRNGVLFNNDSFESWQMTFNRYIHIAAMEGIQEMMERLRSIVGHESWDYCVLWKASKDQRWIEWVDCCCSGSSGGGGGGEDDDGGGEMVFECKDVLFHHPTTNVCHLLSLLPSSMPFDSTGIYGQTMISNQPRWLNLSNSDFSDDQENLGTKALIPVPIGLVELFVSKQISEDEGIINFVTAMFNMPPIDNHPMLNSNNNNNNVESSFSVNMDGLDDGESKDYLLLDDNQKDPHFQPPISPATMFENLNLTTHNNNSNISSDFHPMNFLQHFNYSTNHNRNTNNIMFINHDDPFDPQDNVEYDHEIDMALQGQLMNQNKQPHLMDPPLENNNNNIATKKQVIINNSNDINRSDSVSECSDQNDEEDDPKCRRRNGKPQSKNLVAERKRRKKLNDRLYTLRSLVPNITKLDKASILKDAIEYVMELKRQVEELQNELEENSDDEGTTNNQSTIVEQEVMHANGSIRKRQYGNGHGMLVNGGPQFEAYSGIGTIEVSKHNPDIEDANEKGQQMEPQVEVVSLDGNEFFVKVFCEHIMGGFVRLMEAFNSLGLELTNVNVTSFRCLVLNVFKVERKDSEMVQADHVRESLLEITRNPSKGWPETSTKPLENGHGIMDHHHHHHQNHNHHHNHHSHLYNHQQKAQYHYNAIYQVLN
ncbi:hypothetical protein OSB04_005706 [Centaurea solstitialis]|uniref:BHLH domain-containing protein n=1 Tax=Centaurea solstitialis TaxID=347529 RepID=A0AA38TS48_9ASTR|nr:hypothetical protein OSB04_005706 [Centaurea solstitialis]